VVSPVSGFRRLHFHSDCYWFGGSEHTMVRVAEMLAKDGIDVSLSYRASERYEVGLSQWLPAAVTTYPLTLPDSVEFTERLRGRRAAGPLLAMVGIITHWLAIAVDTVRLFGFFRRIRPDVLHVNNGGYPGAESAQAAVLAARMARVPAIVYTVNNLAFGYDKFSRRVDRPIDRLVVRGVDRFVTGSRAAAARLREVLSLPEDAVTTIPNTVLDRVHGGTATSADHSCALPDDGLVVSAIAILEQRKGHRHLLAAFPDVLADHPGVDITLLIVGDGPEEHRLQQQAADLGISANVRFLGLQDPGPLLERSDVVVLPSIGHEDFPIVVLEAMAAGKPVIASRVAGTPEQVIDGGTGFLVQPGDEQALAARLSQLIGDDRLRHAMGEAARTRFLEEFTAERASERYAAVYHELVGEQREIGAGPRVWPEVPADPLVSVVIPCFNHGRFLGAAIESALVQSHRAIEVVVVDDGSTDDTPEVAASYGQLVRYVAKVNGGLSSARNEGSRRAEGELVVFLDADDQLSPTFVEETLAVLVGHPEAAFVYTQLHLFGRETRDTHFPHYDVELLKWDNYINATALVRAAVFSTFEYAEDLTTGWEDWDFYLTLAEHGIGGVLLDKPLVAYRRHDIPSSMSDAIARQPGRVLRRLRLARRHPALYSPMLVARLMAATAARGARNTARRCLGRPPVPGPVPR
jgi:glycosyltransferase involved in cell wall biosynthesis/GT2 family glycosyltransferase